ncbi:hypothetical protein Acr_24g0009820 [Actinidia rufa]|uniref:Uncharacterized protein n=1 Tax=Actinidia rufa TaxID=165716 RepID=A0A7J0GVI5_9ERIC|nr:hypothetical protein Acr_24g0009820 [Actinidia rufa]
MKVYPKIEAQRLVNGSIRVKRLARLVNGSVRVQSAGQAAQSEVSDSDWLVNGSVKDQQLDSTQLDAREAHSSSTSSAARGRVDESGSHAPNDRRPVRVHPTTVCNGVGCRQELRLEETNIVVVAIGLVEVFKIDLGQNHSQVMRMDLVVLTVDGYGGDDRLVMMATVAAIDLALIPNLMPYKESI